MLIGDYYMILEIDKSEAMLSAEEPEDYSYEITGRVLGLDDECRRILAGRFKLFYMDVNAAMDEHRSIFELFDGRAQTLDYFYGIYETTDSTIQLAPSLVRLLDDEPFLGNVLILDRLEILPKFRGCNLGLLVMRRLIERFRHGAELVAIKPFPLQFECSMPSRDRWREQLKLSELGSRQDQATAKLRRHYGKLGFKHMRGSPFMFRLAERPLPKVSALEK
ncbi:MAG: hypothetical protein WKG03_00190 [Telluria sp.]